MFENDVKTRTIAEARHIIHYKATVRGTAAVFGAAKTTVWVDVTQRLPNISKSLYASVQKVLKQNGELKHIRGGESTKRKFTKHAVR